MSNILVITISLIPLAVMADAICQLKRRIRNKKVKIYELETYLMVVRTQRDIYRNDYEELLQSIRQSPIDMDLFINQIKIQGTMSKKVSMPHDFRTRIVLKPKDDDGDASKVDPSGSEFTTLDDTVVTVEKVDEVTFDVVGVPHTADESVKNTIVKWKLDADRGEGVVTLEGEIEFEITADQATTVEEEIGTPVHQ
ncbi:MAG TPA: hypothetical protein VK644_15000 [Chitinophagaceae bacterium]|nr:hypothetical protein [Chitinophagaceae bacterium]